MNYVNDLNDKIHQLSDAFNFLHKLTSKDYWSTVFHKEIVNTNELIKYLNELVDKISDKELIIHNKKLMKPTINIGKEQKEYQKLKQETLHLKKCYFDVEQIQFAGKNLFSKWKYDKKYNSLFNSKRIISVGVTSSKKVVYDANGYNINGYNRDGFNRRGYDKKGYDKTGYNRKGIDREGYNRKGYDKEGYHYTGYDRDGYNRKGYNKQGYDRYGYNRKGYDKQGYNEEGYHYKGHHRDGYDNYGCDCNGYNRRGWNREGFNRKGYDRDGYNKDGLDRHGRYFYGY